MQKNKYLFEFLNEEHLTLSYTDYSDTDYPDTLS